MEIMVKLWNLHNRTIRVGRTRIPKGDMRPVLENLLWSDRVQGLLKKKWLSRTDPKLKAEVEVKPETKVKVKVEAEVMTSAEPTTFDKSKDKKAKKSEKKKEG